MADTDPNESGGSVGDSDVPEIVNIQDALIEETRRSRSEEKDEEGRPTSVQADASRPPEADL